MIPRQNLYFERLGRPEQSLKHRLEKKVQVYAEGIPLMLSHSSYPELQRLADPLNQALRFGRLRIITSNTTDLLPPVPPFEFANIPNKKINQGYAQALIALQATEPKIARVLVIHNRNRVREMEGHIFSQLDEADQKALALPFVMAASYFHTMQVLESADPAAARDVLAGKDYFTNNLHDLFWHFGGLLKMELNEIARLFPGELHDTADFGIKEFITAVNEKIRENINTWDLRGPQIQPILQMITALRGGGERRNRAAVHVAAAYYLKAFIELRALYSPYVIAELLRDPLYVGTGAHMMVDLIVKRRLRV